MADVSREDFTPAAGRLLPTSTYDRLLSLLTREARWRAALLQILAPEPGERILDVGCGTGSFALLIKKTVPDAVVVGIDPDPEARAIARNKALAAGISVDWQPGFASDAASFGQFDKVVSSLVFHQVPIEEKRAGLVAMFAAARPGGLVCVADYAKQQRWLMRQAFRIVQSADGWTNTQPNVDGFLESELAHICGRQVDPTWAIDTPTGTISIFDIQTNDVVQR